MDLATFVERVERTDVSIGVVTNTGQEQFQNLLARIFERQSVTVEDSVSLPETVSSSRDMVYLLESGEVSAISPLEKVADSVLMVNSDLYTTGARSPDEMDLPDAIAALDETVFRLRGYPESNKEKLLLITISRYIERMSLNRGNGKHRASFQYLSRVDDERGTRAVYDRLADTNVDVHLYGMPDWTPPPEYDVTIHGGWGPDFRDSWFVVHVPDDRSQSHAALVAIENESRTWNGFWTYDTETVREINQYIEREL